MGDDFDIEQDVVLHRLAGATLVPLAGLSIAELEFVLAEAGRIAKRAATLPKITLGEASASRPGAAPESPPLPQR